jgi:hypothetical protein
VAIVHKATLTPGKQELLKSWSERARGTGAALEIIGSYRFDDPAGQVGVEAFLLRLGEDVLHLPLTYRAAPLVGADADLIGTSDHSVLGTRWVYDGTHDPVAVSCFERALSGEQEQAVLELWDGPVLVNRFESKVRVHREPGSGRSALPGSTGADWNEGQVEIVRDVGAEPAGDVQLIAEWGEGRAVVAVLWIPRSTEDEA